MNLSEKREIAPNTWITHRDRYDRTLEPYSKRLFAAAGLAAGHAVLDVGCGTGTTTLEAARRVGPAGTVVGVDINADVAAVARQRAGGLSNVTIITGDAAHYEASDPFDAAISRFGTMMFDDPVVAHANIVHSLRVGGRFTGVVWQKVGANKWHLLPLRALHACVERGPEHAHDAPGPFALANPDRLRGILRDAGLGAIDLQPVAEPVWVATDIADAIAFFDDDAGWSLEQAFGSDTKQAVLDKLAILLEPYATSAGVVVPAAAWLVTATR